MEPELLSRISQTLEEYRKQALTKFIVELMELLVKEGFLLEDVIDAIAYWTDEQINSVQVVKHLENAATELRRAKLNIK